MPYVDASPVGALSLRLPDDLEQQLSQEARLSGQYRSQLLREALEGLLCRRRQERAQAALRGAASVLAGEPNGEPWWR